MQTPGSPVRGSYLFVDQCPNNFLQYTFFAFNWISFFVGNIFWLTKNTCDFHWPKLHAILDLWILSQTILNKFTLLYTPILAMGTLRNDAKLCPWEAVAYKKNYVFLANEYEQAGSKYKQILITLNTSNWRQT